MKNTNFHQPTEWLEVPASRVVLSCLIKLSRIAKGISAEGLSHLLGQTPGFVTHRENMVGGASFTPAMLARIAIILEAPLIGQYQYPRNTTERINVAVREQRKRDFVNHRIFIRMENGSEECICIIHESISQ